MDEGQEAVQEVAVAGRRKYRGELRKEADEVVSAELAEDRQNPEPKVEHSLIEQVRGMADSGEKLFPMLPDDIYRGVDVEFSEKGEDFRPDRHSVAGRFGDPGDQVYWTAPRRAAAANEIAIRVASGESIRAILGTGRDKSRLPKIAVFYSWMFGLGDEYVAQTYRLARQMQAEGYADELIEIADKAQEADEVARVQGYRLAVEVRQFIMAKILPKQYGSQQGAGAGLTINISTNLGGEDTAVSDGTYRATIEHDAGE